VFVHCPPLLLLPPPPPPPPHRSAARLAQAESKIPEQLIRDPSTS
jgi:hypothetical protein